MCQYNSVLITTALQCILKSEIAIPPALFSYFKIVLAFGGLLWFHINFRIICSTTVKNAVGILIGIALHVQIALGSILLYFNNVGSSNS